MFDSAPHPLRRAARIAAPPERPVPAMARDMPDRGGIGLCSMARALDGQDAPAISRDGRAQTVLARGKTAFVPDAAAGNPARLRHEAEALRHRPN